MVNPVYGNKKFTINGTLGGFVPPKVTMAQRDEIALPTAAEIVYQIDNIPGYRFYDGSSWLPLVSGIPDAPADTKYYGRVDNSWGFVVEEAPIDGNIYFRQNGFWTSIGSELGLQEVTDIDRTSNNPVQIKHPTNGRKTEYEFDGLSIDGLFGNAVLRNNFLVGSISGDDGAIQGNFGINEYNIFWTKTFVSEITEEEEVRVNAMLLPPLYPEGRSIYYDKFWLPKLRVFNFASDNDVQLPRSVIFNGVEYTANEYGEITFDAPGGGGIESVTGPNVSNTDPLNPVVNTPGLKPVLEAGNGYPWDLDSFIMSFRYNDLERIYLYMKEEGGAFVSQNGAHKTSYENTKIVLDDTINLGLPSDANDGDNLITEQKTEALLENKQDLLTFDSAPVDGSDNPVTSNGVFDALALKANLVSPTLTGTPTAPTATAGTNTTQIASTAFANAAVSAGNAATATTLQTARTIGIVTGDMSSAGSSFNGSANNTNPIILNTVNSNTGSFGSASNTASFTVNGKGLTTAATNVPIQIAESQVTNLTTDLAAKANTSDVIKSVVVGAAGYPALANTSENIVFSQFIPAGKLSASSIAWLSYVVIRPTVGVGTTTIRVYYNSTLSIPASTQRISQQSSLAANNWIRHQREISFNGGNLTVYNNAATTNPNDVMASASASYTSAYDTTLGYYLIVTLQNATAADAVTITSISLTATP